MNRSTYIVFSQFCKAFNRSWCHAGLSAALLFVMTILRAQAQAPGTGAISGQIYDASGAFVGNARVTVVNEGTNWSRSVTATAEGLFRVPLLAPGNYSVLVDATGFRQKTLPSIHVIISETAVVNVRLDLGSAATVKAQANNSPP